MSSKTTKDAAEAIMVADRMLEAAKRMQQLGLPHKEIDLVAEYALTLANARFRMKGPG